MAIVATPTRAQSDSQVGWVVLRRPIASVANLVVGKQAKPSAILIKQIDWLRQLTVEELWREITTNPTLIEELYIDSVQAELWGLQTGMFVEWKIEQTPKLIKVDGVDTNVQASPKIIRVEGVDEAAVIASLPPLSGIKATKADFPIEPLPLELIGDETIRMLTLLTNGVGKGQRVAIVGPPDSGKSEATERAAYSVIKLLPTMGKKGKVILVHVGESPERASPLEEAMIRALKEIPQEFAEDVEWYNSPDMGEDPEDASQSESNEAHYYTAWFAIQRAKMWTRRGYHVTVLIDSLARILLAYEFSTKIPKPKGEGITSPGVHPSSIKAAKSLVSAAGYYPGTGGSLTIFFTVLGNYSIPRPPIEAALDQYAKSIANAVWAFVGNPTLEYPRIDILETRRRRSGSNENHAKRINDFMLARPQSMLESFAVRAMMRSPVVEHSPEGKTSYSVSKDGASEVNKYFYRFTPDQTPQDVMIEGAHEVLTYLEDRRRSVEKEFTVQINKEETVESEAPSNGATEGKPKKKKEEKVFRYRLEEPPAELALRRLQLYGRMAPVPRD